jgi:hypothetical protein
MAAHVKCKTNIKTNRKVLPSLTMTELFGRATIPQRATGKFPALGSAHHRPTRYCRWFCNGQHMRLATRY